MKNPTNPYISDLLDAIDAFDSIKVWGNILSTYCLGLDKDDSAIANEVDTICGEIFSLANTTKNKIAKSIKA